MTITYLLAYLFTPNVFRFIVPIINIPFVRFVEYSWPGELNQIRLYIWIFLTLLFIYSMWIIELNTDQYCSYSRVSN